MIEELGKCQDAMEASGKFNLWFPKWILRRTIR